MVKLTNSQQVESKKTKGISQQVENDVTSSSLDKTVSLFTKSGVCQRTVDSPIGISTAR